MTALLTVLYVAAIVAANKLASLGAFPVGLGLLAPYGVLTFGLTFGLRDSIHDRIGVRRVFALAVGASVLSFGFGGSVGRIAMAGLAADLLSEAITDTAVYHWLHMRIGKTGGRWGSNLVSLTVDSLIFVPLSGLSVLLGVPAVVLIGGQVLGKLYVSAAWEMARQGALWLRSYRQPVTA